MAVSLDRYRVRGGTGVQYDGRCVDCTKAARANRDPEQHRARHLRRTYGLAAGEYDAMLAAQRGVCAICGLPPRLKARNARMLYVDHCHATGQVRGLLCKHCNSALGLFGDDPEVLRRAIDYVARGGVKV